METLSDVTHVVTTDNSDKVTQEMALKCMLFFFADPEVHPQNEDYWGHVNPIGPRACYDEGKRVAETMCYAYMKQVPLLTLIEDIR